MAPRQKTATAPLAGRPVLALIAAGALLAGVRGATARAAPPPLTVFAAASLTDVLPAIVTAWQASDEGPVRFSFGATSKVVRQVIEGAPADVVITADEDWMRRLEVSAGVEPGSLTVLARNELVFVVANEVREAPASAAELPGALRRIALAGEHVPAGRYAETALERAGVWERVAPRVVRADDVRLALRWVSIGDVEGGVVYRTDAWADPGVRTAFAFAPDPAAPIVYSAAVVRGAARAADGSRFLAFCRSDAARAVLARHGFLPPGP